MIRHVVMFKFKPEVDTKTRFEFVQRLRKLVDDVEVVRTLEIGQNFTQTPRSSDLVLMVDLDDEDALAAYADHPMHQPVKKMLSEICSETRVVDYVLPD